MRDRTTYFDLLSDQFGNYVLQKSLSVAQEPQLTQFLSALQPEVMKLQNHSEFAFKIYQRLVKKYPSLDPSYKDSSDGKARQANQPGKRPNATAGLNKNQKGNNKVQGQQRQPNLNPNAQYPKTIKKQF